ncbi:MAG: hypothetical protein II743_01380 [Lachnospiraceae bacterium]|nr:hypothetical protein [Lachnospiraceae bacterium]
MYQDLRNETFDAGMFGRMMVSGPPGEARPQGGIAVPEAGAEIELVPGEGDCMDRMKGRVMTLQLPIRFDAHLRNGGGRITYRSERHRRVMMMLLREVLGNQTGRCGNQFWAAAFLLSADEWLWSVARDHVGRDGIDFERLKVRGATTEQYFLYHAARQSYLKEAFISEEELADEELVSGASFMNFFDALMIERHGFRLLLDGEVMHDGRG